MILDNQKQILYYQDNMNKIVNEEVKVSLDYLKLLGIKIPRKELLSYKKWLAISLRIAYKQGMIDTYEEIIHG